MKYAPVAVSQVDLAVGPQKINELLPSYKEVPEEFKRFTGNKWVDIVSRWFFNGLPEDTQYFPKQGIDTNQALAHLGACLASWEPKHEHKTAGVAYLLSEWFDDIKIPK